MLAHTKNKLTRWLTAASVILGVGVVGPVVTAPAASAATSCSGTLIDQINHTDPSSGARVATTYLYWDGTYNCALSVKAGSYYGVSSRMALVIMTSSDQDGDSGFFKYQAGPVKVNGRGKCIAFELDMWKPNGGPNFLQDRVPAGGYFHCG